MATTTNFGWETPDDTDLVKDGALAMRTLGNAIDASMADLKGGTTGQVLSKNSNTDMDFVWVTSDDANAIQNAIVDAKGDLITATANDTPARLAVGSNGDTLVADSAASTGLRWQGNFAAGKNKIINGDFGIWQRGTSSAAGGYLADRWRYDLDGTGGTVSQSQQTFTPGTAPIAGYEGTYYLRFGTSVARSGQSYSVLNQRIEDVRTFAGQTVTLSFWARLNSGIAADFKDVYLVQNFGSGGSSSVTSSLYNPTLSSSWARYSATFTLASVSGKTIGSSSFLSVEFGLASNKAILVDIWGVQLEAGSVATAFQTATGTIQGELAACRYYYYKTYDQGQAPAAINSNGVRIIQFNGVNAIRFGITYPTMRTAPSITTYNPSTGASGSIRADNLTNQTLNGPYNIGDNGAFVDITPSGGAYGQFHFVASAEL